MGVDGIGGPRGPFTPPGVGGAGTSGVPASGVRAQGDAVDPLAARGAGEAEVGAVGSSSAAEVERARLVRGELTLDQYLELQVEHATVHLVDQTSPAVLEQIRGALRQELATDPVLLSLTNRLGAG